MKQITNNLIIIISLLLATASIACSDGQSNPAMPDENNVPGMEQMADADGGSVTHGVLGVYKVTFDPDTMTIEAVEDRQAATHYDITPYLGSVVSFTLLTWDPVMHYLSFEMHLTNPSTPDVFDLRAIFMSDPSSGYTLLNPDDYTRLFNPFGPDDVNPFRAYAKSDPSRNFNIMASHTETFEVGTPATIVPPMDWTLLVECSWPDNCEDAYEISNQSLSNPITSSIPGYITLDAYDHQDNIGQVYVDTTPITGGLTWLTNTGGTVWEGGLHNSAGAAPGIYRCMITVDSSSSPDNLYDFIDIEVAGTSTPPILNWHRSDYPLLHESPTLDLGVIADLSGPRDSHILMAEGNAKICDDIIIYDPYYPCYHDYVNLTDVDAAALNYQPQPVVRLDAADDGAFSFTNSNTWDNFPDPMGWTNNSMVWSVFDNTPQLHTGPYPDDGRYYFNLVNCDIGQWPVDVCDDFALGQYALFSSGETYSPYDLLFVGTNPPDYTHANLKYFANLDPWAGIGDGLVNPEDIRGIDVVNIEEEIQGYETVALYVLEQTGSMSQVEVFYIFNSDAATGVDIAMHSKTIKIDCIILGIVTHMAYAQGKDIEILPANPDYELNPNEPTLAVLVSYGYSGMAGDVLLYNASTGDFLEAIGGQSNPPFPESEIHYLDTDDDNWEIHVTHEFGSAGMASVFDYS